MHGKVRNAYKILVGKPEGKSHSEDLGINEKIILEWILGKQRGEVRCRLEASGSG
jgi:hypothetical protein